MMTLFANQKIVVRLISALIVLSLQFLFVVLLATIVNASDESAGSLRNTKGDVLIERLERS